MQDDISSRLSCSLTSTEQKKVKATPEKALTNKQTKKLGRILELYLRSFGNGTHPKNYVHERETS